MARAADSPRPEIRYARVWLLGRDCMVRIVTSVGGREGVDSSGTGRFGGGGGGGLDAGEEFCRQAHTMMTLRGP